MTASRAEELLAAAAAEPDRGRRHLIVAAALHEVLRPEPVVVGGIAEDYWAQDDYHPTDLDLCGVAEPELLEALGFSREGRKWWHEAAGVEVEFPEARIEGDESRVVRVAVAGGTAAIIGLDDLYLDRVRQCTAYPDFARSTEYAAALSIAARRHDRIDWAYVRDAIAAAAPHLRRGMERADRSVRDTLARRLAKPS